MTLFSLHDMIAKKFDSRSPSRTVMSIRVPCFVTAVAVLALSLSACSSDPAAALANNGGAASAGKSGGSSAAGVAGLASAGQSGGGAAGFVSSAGTSSGGAGGSGGAGASSVGGGSAGSNAAGAAGSSGSTVEPSFATVKLVFGGGGGIQSCAGAPCHGVGGNAPPGNPVTLADTDQLYTNLTSYISKACGNKKLVVPGKPADSALLSILKGPCGATPQMPLDCKPSEGSCIPDEYVAAIAQWISDGAPKE